MDVTKVQPFKFPGLNKALLSTIQPIPTLKDLQDEQIYSEKCDKSSAIGLSVPVIQGQDVDDIIQANTKKGTKDITSTEAEFNDLDDLYTDNYDQGMEIDTDPVHYVEMQNFRPQNLQEQVATIIVENFPYLTKSAIDRVLQILVSNFTWSTIESELIESHLLFVRLNSINDVPKFIEKFTGVKSIVERLKIVCDPNLFSYINPATGTTENVQVPEKSDNSPGIQTDLNSNIKASLDSDSLLSIKKIVLNPKNRAKSVKSGTEDLDEVMSYYSSYKVDPKELADVPNDMRPVVIREIIKFRSRVLEIEKERRNQEIEVKRKKAKENLQKLYHDIQESGSMQETQQTDQDMNIETSNFEKDFNEEVDNLDDKEYSQHLQALEKRRKERIYKKEYDQMSHSETFERKVLVSKLLRLKNYENYLIDNKSKFIDEFKNYKDTPSANVRLYLRDKSEYFRIRTKEKIEEEEYDARDREREAKEQKSQETHQNKQAFSFTISKTKDVSIPEKEVPTNITIGSFDSSKLTQITNYIGDLLEEYLGLREESLIEFIYQYLIDNDLKEKKALIQELAETLDDDAEVVVDELWKFILNL